MSGTKGNKNYPLKMGAIRTRESDGWGTAFELAMDHLGLWFKRVLLYHSFLMYVES